MAALQVCSSHYIASNYDSHTTQTHMGRFSFRCTHMGLNNIFCCCAMYKCAHYIVKLLMELVNFLCTGLPHTAGVQIMP